MPLFLYKAKKGPEEIVQGTLEAENEDAALGKITERGLVAIQLHPVQELTPAVSVPEAEEIKTKEQGKGLFSQAQKKKIRVSHKELNVFTRQFAIILKAHVPLLKIFEILQTQTASAKFRKVLRDIQSLLREGESISAALKQYPRIFSEIYASMVHAGEVSGTLDKVLGQLAEFSEKEAEIRTKVQNAFIYPLFLLFVGIATVFVLLTFVMPRLIVLFSDLGTALPLPTQIIIKISYFLQAYWVTILLGTAVVAFILRSGGLSPSQKKIFDQFKLSFPIFGNLILKSETAKFLRSVELLYESGIPLYQAVRIGSETVSNLAMREKLLKVPELLEGGKTFAKSLEEVPYISRFVSQMISVGEESGQLGVSARETAVFYEQETDQAVKIATTLLEPLMILAIGIVIGGIVISMLLPIFEIHALAQ